MNSNDWKVGLLFGLGFIVFIGTAYIYFADPQPIITFGPVEVRAYTAHDPGNRWDDGCTATGHRILTSDYSVAVSPDIEKWLGGISDRHVMHVPGYNKPGEWSAVNDRSDIKERSIEVLMTAGDTRARALRWGVRRGVLKAIKTPAGMVSWVEFEGSK